MNAFLVILAIIGIALVLCGLAVLFIHLYSYVVVEIKMFKETITSYLAIRKDHLKKMNEFKSELLAKKRETNKVVKQLKADNKRQILLEKSRIKNTRKESIQEVETLDETSSNSVAVKETKVLVEEVKKPIEIKEEKVSETVVTVEVSDSSLSENKNENTTSDEETK